MKRLLENVLKLVCKDLDIKASVLIRSRNDYSDVVASAAKEIGDYKILSELFGGRKIPTHFDSNSLKEEECCKRAKEKLKLKEIEAIEIYKDDSISYSLLLLSSEEVKPEFPPDLRKVLLSLVEVGESLLEKNIKDYSTFTDSIGVPAIVSDNSGKVVLANHVFKQEFKWNESKNKNLSELQLFNEKGEPFNAKTIFAEDFQQGGVLIFPASNEYFKIIKSEVFRESNRKLFLILFVPVTKYISDLLTYNQALENVDVVIYSMKADRMEFDFISPAVSKIFGFKASELEKNKISLLRNIRKSEYPKVRKFLRDIRNGKPSIIEYGIVDARNQIRYIRHSGIPIEHDGKIEKLVGAIVDVTPEVRLREKLRYSEEKLKLLMETTEDLIFTLDNRGNFLLINKNGSQILGYTVEEMLGRHFLEFVTEDNKADVAIAFQNILKSDEVVRFEVKLLDNFGEEIIFEIQARPIKSGDKIDGMMAIGRDMTERIKHELELKDLNSKLIEANRIISIERDRAKEKITVLEELNRLKNEFISNVSHELRTPLASIVGFAEAIASDNEMPRETITEFNNIIYSEGRRLARLINDLLDFSKLESEGEQLEKSDFDLMPLLNEIISSYKTQADEKGVTLSASVPEAEIILYGDKERIKNAIGHIISNAVKFTGKGGRVSVLVNNFLNEVEILVSDTGIGIPNEDIPKLFEKFTKVNRPGNQIPGAGIGLAMAKKIIDLHNGLINVKSKVNEGTTFIIRLPKKV